MSTMPRLLSAPARFTPALLCAATAGAVAAASAGVPALAQSSVEELIPGSSASTSPGDPGDRERVSNRLPQKKSSGVYQMENGTTIQIMDDVVGTHSAHVGFRAGDLGAMAPIGKGEEFAMIFGDSFTLGFGRGQWMSPVGVVAKMDEDGFIQILRPLNAGDKVKQMFTYVHGDSMVTLLPSDVININGTLYLQAMWNQGLHNVLRTEIYKSTDNGRTWTSVAVTPHSYMGGKGDLITWDKGPDGYIYVMSSSFTRTDPVYLSRFKPQDIGDRSKWELFNKFDGTWGDEGWPVLNNVKAGEMNLRFIDGHWVMVMFNQETLSVEVRISENIDVDWEQVPVATVAQHGSWVFPQTPMNWSQPYGGYIVPGSTLDNMDIVISQWNTGNNSRYTSTQFNVKGLDTFFGVERKAVEDNSVIEVEETPAEETDDMRAEDNLVENQPEVFVPAPPAGEGEQQKGSSEQGKTAAIVLGSLAAIGLAGAAAYPLYAPMLKGFLPPQLAAMLP